MQRLRSGSRNSLYVSQHALCCTLASLISLDERDYDKATALELAAGPRLYNVVVTNDAVGKDLLEHGRLKKRVTIIPLNKITAHTLTNQVCISVTHLRPLLTIRYVLIERGGCQETHR